MAVTIVGNNTPTAGGVVYGDGSNYASTAVGTAGQVLVSAGAAAPGWGTPAVTAPGGTTGQVQINNAGAFGAVASGTSGQVLTSAGAGVAPAWGTVSAGYTLGTPVATTSGTIISFTGIPTGVKQVVINFKNVSSNSVGNFSIQLGTSAGIRTSGYNASAVGVGTGPSIVTDTSDTLFVLTGSKAAINFFWGSITLTLENSTNNTWVSSGLLNSDSSVKANMSAGYVNLPGVLTQLQIQALGDTFDSGEINIAYI